MIGKYFYLLGILSIISLIPVLTANASSNPNLSVSAENTQFDNHFSGSMVVEVVIRDNDILNTDEGKGEPDVTLNGKTLRMVQASDGNWYAYFANADKAKIADSTVGLNGEGLDFGVFCSRDTSSSVFGISLSETDGFSIPHSNGILGSTDGNSSFNQCTGTLNPSNSFNNVVRNSKFINTNPAVPVGQIGLDQDAWPLIQLFSFDDVTIQYNAAGDSQRVELEYDEIPNISLLKDRDLYPQNAEVFVTINDFQLNQDPTDEDSWTFSVESPLATFYQAFDNNGQQSADNTIGLVNLLPHLSKIGFDNNGSFYVDLDSVIELRPNSNQNDQTSVDDGSAPFDDFSQIVTLVEKGPNSGIFESFDFNDHSTMGIDQDASRGRTGTITYNDDSISILTGFSTASVSLQKAELKVESTSKSLSPGIEYSLVLVDPDQNINTGSQDDLDVFRDSSLIPTIRIGNPITLEKSSNVIFYPNPNDFLSGETVSSSILDKNSARLFIDTLTNPLAATNFKQISMNLGITSSELRSILMDSNNSNNLGTNWFNYDFRSIEEDFKINDFSDTKLDLYFGSLSSIPITIAEPGDLPSSKGFIQLDNSIVDRILQENGAVFLVINFGSSDFVVSNELDLQPIIFDIFSFGLDNQLNGVNNSIYRFELEETSDNSSTFEGTFEYAIVNQLNVLDANFIKTINTVGDDVEFLVTDRSVDEDGIFISYSDLDEVGLSTTTSTQSDIVTHSGVISTGSNSYRFGQSIVVILNDPDLNLKSDRIDIYSVIDDPNSPFVDTVGSNGQKLLEILLKDVRYKRCTINGVEHGGLASTGFRLIETGQSTGVFEGSFNMPSKICNKSGTQLMSPAGGSIELKYTDSRDESGKSNIVSSLNNRQISTTPSVLVSQGPQLSATKIPLPLSGNVQEVILSGSINNQKKGMPISINLVHPNGNLQEFNASVTSSGNYKAIFTINSNSLPGKYQINLVYDANQVGSVHFDVLGKNIPSWIKDNARWWSSSIISDSEFIDGIEYLMDENIITVSSTSQPSSSDESIPSWIKDNARWWANDNISDDDFIQAIQYLIEKGIIQV
ncbi:peptidase [Nitrosopumilus sp.]|uniref:peptidase n=1 Tax=Nitrosopumilus sp. TaxID=2024843 RepID=UPI00292E09FA|nr:peptidase [Nitrosopumilus sp.]